PLRRMRIRRPSMPREGLVSCSTPLSGHSTALPRHLAGGLPRAISNEFRQLQQGLNGAGISAVKIAAVICHRFKWFRALVAGFALLMAAAPFLDVLHLAAVRHVTCPEDGELIEASFDHTG